MKSSTLITSLSAICLCLIISCKSQRATVGTPPSHDKWTKLLQKHVTEAGVVDYKGFVKDSVALNEYLALLSANHPGDSWTDDQKFAYWVNAYNAFTVKLIVKNYPVKSIKDLGGSIYKVNTPWAESWIDIGGVTYSLDNIEHGILRKDFEEPRVHFACNCASVSCPRLRNEAYTAEKLDAQLDDQARYFINNKNKNQIISPSEAIVSSIFSWFKGDFTKNGRSLVEYLNQYSEIKLNESAKISTNKYNWDLNEERASIDD